MNALGRDRGRYPILVVDDEANNLEVFRLRFRRRFEIHTALGAEEAFRWVAEHPWPAVVVVDQRMPGRSGIEVLREIASKVKDIVGIVVTAYSDWDALFEALNSGLVYRYLLKPWQAREMEIVLQQALDHLSLLQENKRLIRQLSQMNAYLESEIKGGRERTEVLGADGGLRAVMTLAEQVASSTSTILLRGESGTGKEVMARAIHEMSPRAGGPFVKVSCAALSSGLLESELFGHERGAFTGATGQRIGRFELASGGTLFLDEIGDVPLDIQVKLLRVLQEREFERVGGSRTVRVDVRVIAATHRNLEDLIKEGRFREDLYYRLNVFPLFLPPLRRRKEDIPILVRGFIERFRGIGRTPIRGITPAALRILCDYDWPGNVRELQNVVERAILLARKDVIDIDVFDDGGGITGLLPPSEVPSDGRTGPTGGEREAARDCRDRCMASEAFGGHERDGGREAFELPSGRSSVIESHGSRSEGGSLDESSTQARGADDGFYAQLVKLERAELEGALLKARGNKARAARLLGISRTTFYYRLKKCGLWRERAEGEES